MNQSITATRRQSIEAAIRTAISDPRAKQRILDATGWDKSVPSKLVQDNPHGITLDKLDAVLSALDCVVVTRRYLDAVTTLGEVGMFCCRARDGMGECGAGR
ncbi:DNA-binding protein [Paraburkholderia sp. MM5477-R1]|uniref:DNA-binding protein n=1 Tax=Paraburkholderia sp. MM5477-R1 TaxID=2991062 RepID=UPI003D191897